MTRPNHRVVVWPWSRRVGGLFLRNWLAITLGRTIVSWRALRDDELEHELQHIRQWQRHGVTFPVRYLAASVGARRSGKRWYDDNRFEVEARDAVRKFLQS